MTRCLAARHNLLVDVDGKIKLCCNNHESLDQGADDLALALTGSVAQTIRNDLEQNRRHSSCDLCWSEEDQTGSSYRIDYGSLYPDYQDLPEVGLRTLHMQSENTCNLTCVYCGPTYSSKWAQLLDYRVSHRGLTRISDQTLSSLDMITFAGGEPALIKTNIDILQRLYEVNPGCQIIVNTNLTCYGNDFFKICQRFAHFKILVSFEAIESRYEYIRHLARWPQFRDNFILACREVPQVEASMIFFALSAGTFDRTLDFVLQHLDAESVFLNTYKGYALGWELIGSKSLERIQNNVLALAAQLQTPLQEQLIMHASAMKSTADTTYIPWLLRFDKLNNINHRNIFRELYE